MTATHDWLVDWFARKGPVPGSTGKERAAVNYFDAGLIDSLGVIELIGDVEARFAIRFGERHFQDRRFATIGGLAAIVDELRAAGGAG